MKASPTDTCPASTLPAGWPGVRCGCGAGRVTTPRVPLPAGASGGAAGAADRAGSASVSPLSPLPPLPTGTPGDAGVAAGVGDPVLLLLPPPLAASAGSTGAAVGGGSAASLPLPSPPLPPMLSLPPGAPSIAGAAVGASGVRPAGGRDDLSKCEGAVCMQGRCVPCVPSS